MNLSDFDYTLPKELIAQYPLKQRDEAKLLVLNLKDSSIRHLIFKDIVNYLNPGDTLVLNNTKVLPARLTGRRLSGGKVEVLLLSHKSNLTFRALIKPGRLKVQEKIIFNNEGLSGLITSKNEITFYARDINTVYSHGQMPLPPYIKRIPEDLDREYYQTVYAESEGAVAAPTAGLHFTRELIKRIKSQGINTVYITLHIGYGTFRPVKSLDIRQHKMDAEYFKIPDDAVNAIEKRQGISNRIVAVGTTTLRALETYANTYKKEGYTDLFIYPGYKFKAVDCLLTNFHLPRTTLFMLVCAFAGIELIKKAYQEAIDRQNRFYSYGDAMLIIKR